MESVLWMQLVSSESAGNRPVLLLLLRHVAVESQCVGRAGQRSLVHLELIFLSYCLLDSLSSSKHVIFAPDSLTSLFHVCLFPSSAHYGSTCSFLGFLVVSYLGLGVV